MMAALLSYMYMEGKRMIDDIITRIRESYRIKLLEKELREERLIRRLSDEYEDFREDELSKSKEEIFDDASKINFYFELYNYFLEYEFLDDDITKFLSDMDYPLCFLWDEYLRMDGCTIGSWEDIDIFLMNVKDWNIPTIEDDEMEDEAI